MEISKLCISLSRVKGRCFYFGTCEKCSKSFYTPATIVRFCSIHCSKSNKIPIKCNTCKKTYFQIPSEIVNKKRHFCSMKCRNILYKYSGNPNWKDGKSILPYKTIRINGKQIRRHRYIMEKKIGRKLKHFEVVHHINHNPKDDRISNLKIMTRNSHMLLHREYNKVIASRH